MARVSLNVLYIFLGSYLYLLSLGIQVSIRFMLMLPLYLESTLTTEPLLWRHFVYTVSSSLSRLGKELPIQTPLDITCGSQTRGRKRRPKRSCIQTIGKETKDKELSCKIQQSCRVAKN